jgi:hypothetical protein
LSVAAFSLSDLLLVILLFWLGQSPSVFAPRTMRVEGARDVVLESLLRAK